ncbi:unnamed protein product [Symbiodinium natans]|uniref:Uncharacterized protein n=1 Tax=Symbiodinium natans TaxID=878477 RepID=A0A812GYM4_9DINO|nr:unnamed protein product [Symbiodinium natans]
MPTAAQRAALLDGVAESESTATPRHAEAADPPKPKVEVVPPRISVSAAAGPAACELCTDTRAGACTFASATESDLQLAPALRPSRTASIPTMGLACQAGAGLGLEDLAAGSTRSRADSTPEARQQRSVAEPQPTVKPWLGQKALQVALTGPAAGDRLASSSWLLKRSRRAPTVLGREAVPSAERESPGPAAANAPDALPGLSVEAMKIELKSLAFFE